MSTRLGDISLILRRCALRHWRHSWKQQLMLLTILALGTGVHVAMRLANRSALAGFERFTDGITKESDWTVQAAAGPMKQTWLRDIRQALGPLPVTLLPCIEATVVPDAAPGQAIGSRPTWRLMGMDLIALQNLRTSFPAATGAFSVSMRSVFVTAEMAKKQGWQVGSKFDVVINDRLITLNVGGLLPSVPDAPSAPDHLLLMDLPNAQALLNRPDEIDKVEVIATNGPAFPDLRQDAATALRKAAAERWQVMGHEDRHALAGNMTAAFRLNLNVLSLLALLVGGYLMFQALDGVVIRRRQEIAVLRSLGINEGAIRAAFLIEAAMLGTVGGLAGVMFGWVTAQGSVLGVAKTMTALYGASTATYASLTLDEALLGVLLCITTSIVAAWWPARNAAATPPAQALSRYSAPVHGGSLRYAEKIGFGLCIAALVFSQVGPLRLNGMRVPLAAYTAALLWMLGAGLVASRVLRAFHKSNDAVRRVAFSNLRMPSVRHRFAVAALTSAVAMTCGMAVMIASFDGTMRNWIVRTMKANIYVSSAGAQSASATSMISQATVSQIRAMAQVQEVVSLSHMPASLLDGPVRVMGCDMEFNQRMDLHAWVDAPARDWWKTGPPQALINESLTERLDRRRGDMIQFPTPAGIKEVRIAGVFADYGNERGTILLPQATFREWFNNDMAWRIAVMLKPGADAETVRSMIQQANPGLSVFTQSHLRSEALRIFKQTFAVTYALEAVGVIVAVAGLGLALGCLMLDRRQDLFTLRAVGFTSQNVARACAWEGFGLALGGVGTGIVSGFWLGWLLIERVNKQSFGWTLSFHIPYLQIIALAAAVLGTGVVVSSLVGRWASTLTSDQEE